MENKFDSLPEQTVELEGKPKPTGDFLDDYFATLGDGTLSILGIKTGFDALDRKTLGLDGLIVLGGIAGQGKTSLALQLAFEASDCGTPTLFYSLEMPRRAILTKLLNRLSRVDYSEILLRGRVGLGTDEVKRLERGRGLVKAIGEKFYIRSRERGEADITFETVEREINILKAQHGAEKVFVVVDHLQVFPADNYKDQIDKEGILINGFKGISERTGATILLISQKNKAGFTQKGGLQSIKGSVDIVYLADVVMFLEDPQAGELDDLIASEWGSGEARAIDLILAKNRYNAPGKIELQFNGRFSEFTEKPGH